ncbi:putative HTH-type transcriptional regulator [uncultured archaeon]|nr:putative HTH-type transcriptional regulator [uncultured archaeon]
MDEFKLDEKDIQILDILRTDASKTKKQIAKRLNLPLTTVHNRIRKMERAGVITGYKAAIDAKRLGLDVSAYISISVQYAGWDYSQTDTAKKIRSLEGVESVAIVAGGTDIVAKVRKKNTQELNDFVVNRLRKIPGVNQTTTMVILSEFD